MKERKQPIKPTQSEWLENDSQFWLFSTKWYNRFFGRIALMLELIGTMLWFRVGWLKAYATVDQKYFQKCLDTGKANYLYRPGDISNGEVGPQHTGVTAVGVWDWIWLLLIILWLYRRIKKAKR